MPKNTRIMNLEYLPMHLLKIKNHNFSIAPQHVLKPKKDTEREKEEYFHK